MIQNALHILGPVSGLHLDPFLLVDSQSKGIGGYVMICLADRGVSREYYLLCFDGEGSVDCVRLTAEGRSFIGVDIARSEYSLMDKGRVMVHLFTIDSSPMERFFATLRNEPCFKIRIDTLRRRQVEMLVRTYGSQEVLAERNDLTSELPRMEFQPMFPGQPLPIFAMGFGRGGFLLYRCLEAEGLPNGTTVPSASPDLPGVAQSSTHFTPAIAMHPGGLGVAQPAAQPTTAPPNLPPRSESAPRGAPSMSAPTAPSAGPKNVRPGAHGTRAGAFVDAVRDALRPGSVRATRAAKSTEPPEQLDFLPTSKVPGDSGSPATVSAKGRAQVPEIVGLLQQLVDDFRRQTMSILGSKGVLVFESCERQLRKQMSQFRSDEIDDETALLAVDLIDAVVRAAPLLKRSKLRGITLTLIADLYNKHFEVLNRHGLIPRVEEVYFTHKK